MVENIGHHTAAEGLPETEIPYAIPDGGEVIDEEETGNNTYTKRQILTRLAAVVGGGGVVTEYAIFRNSQRQDQQTGTGQQDPVTNSTPTPEGTESRTEESTEQGSEEQTAEERVNNQIREGIPLEGLGAYEDAVLEADQPDAATIKQIDSILEGENTPEELRNGLDDIATTDNLHQVMRYFHQQHQNQEETVVINRNWSFTSDSEPILELYTVKNGELQNQPTITDTRAGQVVQTNKPGQENPQYLADLRDSTDWAQNVSQDYQSIQQIIDRSLENNNPSEQDVREYRADKLQDWSRVMFGVDDEPKVRPHNVDTADTVFEAMYGDGDAEILAELSNEYDSEDYDADTLVEVEYTGSSWNFHTPDNREMGDPLEGEEGRFS